MSDKELPLEHLLVAYLDGETDEAQTAEVEAWLTRDAAAQAQLNRLIETTALAREAFDDVLREPVPAELLRAATMQSSAQILTFRPKIPGYGRLNLRIPQRWGSIAAAAAVVAFVAGGSLDYVTRGSSGTSSLDNIAGYHNLFVGSAEADENAVWDVPAGSEQKLPGDVYIPNLKPWGLAFQGARMLVVEGKPAYQFYYKTDNKALGEITLTTWSSTKADSVPSFETRENVNLMYWRRSGHGYAVVGHADKGYMWGLAQDVAYQVRN